MIFEEWLALSDSERLVGQSEWQPFVDGYWHELVAEVANRLPHDIGYLPTSWISTSMSIIEEP
jgi:hypothetical protein